MAGSQQNFSEQVSISPFTHATNKSVIGEPQVTSAFLTDRLRDSLTDHVGCEIFTKPLEAEGTVGERLERHLAQVQEDQELCGLLGSESSLCIFIAHSQGVPISAFLIRELLKLRILNSLQNVQLIGLAGIMEGPHKPIRQHPAVKYYEGRPAKELFHFGKKDAKLKTDMDEWLMAYLANGGRMILISSWKDQVVPLNSAILCTFSAHPNLRRYVYIPSNVDPEAEPVLKLIQLCIELMNLPEYSELGSKILSSISERLVPNMYTGKGHSALATNTIMFPFLAEQCLSFSHENGIQARCSRSNLEVSEDFLGWLLHDLRNVKDRLIQSKVSDFIESLSEWKPANPEWIFFAEKLAPLVAFR